MLNTKCVASDFSINAIARANAAIETATPRAQADPAHPIFHVTAPAQWINDPNGPIYYKGYYHLFYQLNPFSENSGPKYWGHARSRNLVKWETLPVALWPSTDAGEAEVWSGCCTINGEGKPMIFYTSIAPGKSPQTDSTQWAAIGDDNLITWQKSPANPVLTQALHGNTKIYDWRDPFIFHEKNRTFMVAGGNLNSAKGGEAVVNIYEAQNPRLTEWIYRGVLFKLPDSNAATAECPNFFRLYDHWVLLVSPYGKVQYFIGDFDLDTCRFTPTSRGLLDVGPNYYAPNTLLLNNGKRLVWGWVTGFPGGHGWNGCLSLPRQLSFLGNQLLQKPAPELSKLRGVAFTWRSVPLDETGHTYELQPTNTIELQTEIDLKSAKRVSLEFTSRTNGAPLAVLNFGDGAFTMEGAEKTAITYEKGKIHVHIFIDRSVMEIFINDTVCATRTVRELAGGFTFKIRATGGVAQADWVESWPMKNIW